VNHEIQIILSAAQYAAEKHANQKRKGQAAEPYVNHVIDVANLVSTAVPEQDTNLVIAALLHDTIEDTGVTEGELVERFGQDVTNLVLELTDDKSLPDAERKRLQVEHAPKLSVRAQTIKLADKITNLRGILTSPTADWDYERKRQYFEWGKQVVDGFTVPNPILKTDFERTYRRFGEVQP
jgi:GTP diphosphokinase / guanosine-3',5'-bis(diphosphate) 3'-diphosphatase